MSGSITKQYLLERADEPRDAGKINPVPLENSNIELPFLESLTLIRKVASGRVPPLRRADVADIVQETACRLWKWLTKNQQRREKMTRAEWDLFAARSAHNELNRYWSKHRNLIEVPVEEASPLRCGVPQGDAEMEVISLVRNVWQEICRMTLRQRRSLILHSPELVLYFLRCEIREQDLARILGVNVEEWSRISLRLPLTDLEIAEIQRDPIETRDVLKIARSIRKARFDARRRLERLRK